MAKRRAPVFVAGLFVVLSIPTVTTAQVKSRSAFPKLEAGTVYAPELKIPSDALNQFREGTKDYNASRYEESVEHFKAAGRLYPKYSLAYAALAMSLLQLHRFDVSHKAVDVALSLNRNSPDAVIALGALLFYESKFREAEIQLQRVTAVLPHEPRTRLLLGGIALLRSDYSEVIRQTNEIEEGDVSKYPSTFLIRGEAFEKLGLAREAVESYERYLQSNGKARINRERARDAILKLNAGISETRIEPAN